MPWGGGNEDWIKHHQDESVEELFAFLKNDIKWTQKKGFVYIDKYLKLILNTNI